MKKLLSLLTVYHRFVLINTAALLVIAICCFLVWNTSRIFNRDMETLQQLSEFETGLIQIRNNYNGIKGDMMTSLIATPLTQKQYISEAGNMFKIRVGELEKNIAGNIQTMDLPQNIAQLRDKYIENLEKYLAFCKSNLAYIQNVPPGDSESFSRARNLMVENFYQYYSPLTKTAIATINAVSEYRKNIIAANNSMRTITTWATAAICIAVAALISAFLYFTGVSVIEPVKQARQALEELSSGKLTDIKTSDGKDELSSMLRSLSSLNTHMNYLVDFAGNVAKNNFGVKANMFDGKGAIAIAMTDMRDSLKTAYASEKLRSWSSEGLGKFSEIIRNHQHDHAKVSHEAVRFLTGYLGAQQGGLFTVQNEDQADQYLELAACYAFNKKKYMNKRIEIGEGLIWQAYQEGDTLFLTDVPDGYTQITSGLGDATPNCVVIVPMKYNDRVEAIIELAGFHIFEKHQTDFLEKAGEFVASAMVNAKTTARMQTILNESQTQTAQLRTQEEEMRQNLEELSATQEGMQRVLKESEGKEQYMYELINVSKDTISTIDKNYKLINYNKTLVNAFESLGLTATKGFDMLQLYATEAQKQRQKVIYDKVLSGERYEETDEHERNGEKRYYLTNYAPLFDTGNNVYGVAAFSKDVTEMMRARKETEKLLVESQSQAEQLRSQEEELRQNMEELSATQEAIVRKQEEVEASRAENERIKQAEAERSEKIAEMQKKTMLSATQKLKEKVAELQETKAEMEKSKNEIEKLLAESQGQSEELRAQEEELRQNMEEMQATQEELTRKQEEIEANRTENEVVKQAEAERSVKIAEMQKKTMLSATQKLKDKVAELQETKAEMEKSKNEIEKLLAESQGQSEELRAQEEELRQNMEEMQATQEELARRQEEVETARAENERLKQAEAERSVKIADMQKKAMLSATQKLKDKIMELEETKILIEKERSASQIKSQKKIMEQFMTKQKEKEKELLAKIQILEKELAGKELNT